MYTAKLTKDFILTQARCKW